MRLTSAPEQGHHVEGGPPGDLCTELLSEQTLTFIVLSTEIWGFCYFNS